MIHGDSSDDLRTKSKRALKAILAKCTHLQVLCCTDSSTDSTDSNTGSNTYSCSTYVTMLDYINGCYGELNAGGLR